MIPATSGSDLAHQGPAEWRPPRGSRCVIVHHGPARLSKMATSCAQSMCSPIHLSIEPRHQGPSRSIGSTAAPPSTRVICSSVSSRVRRTLRLYICPSIFSSPARVLLLCHCALHFQISQKLGVWAVRTWGGLYCFCGGQIWVGAERVQRLSGRN